ncbi:MAG: DUF2802 domain-containing protein [Hydrogenophilales bacterium]|nr:DUF2802 domain-containing protein [Hydrogenophilales bacterium]
MPAIVITDRDVFVAMIVAIFVFVVVVVAVASLGMRLLRAARQIEVAGSRLNGDAMQEIESLRQRVAYLENRLPSQAISDPDEPEDALYGRATRLLSQGLAPDEVADRLGLSRAEIDLIAVLQRAPSLRGREGAPTS